MITKQLSKLCHTVVAKMPHQYLAGEATLDSMAWTIDSAKLLGLTQLNALNLVVRRFIAGGNYPRRPDLSGQLQSEVRNSYR